MCQNGTPSSVHAVPGTSLIAAFIPEENALYVWNYHTRLTFNIISANNVKVVKDIKRKRNLLHSPSSSLMSQPR